jgi:hypothetical protein
MRAFILSAALVVVSRSATAQNPLSNAKAVAQKAANATNAHIEAEQRPDGQTKAAAATAPASKATSAAPASKTAPAAAPASKPVNAAPAAKAVAGKTAAVKAASAAPASDTAAPPATIYRESFDYASDGRRDPFFTLLSTNELRPAMSDLRLTGVLYDHTGRHSVATLRDIGTNAQYRVTTGSTLGRMRVSNIRYTTVVFTIDEFGTTRQDSLILRDTTKARGK